MVSESTSVVAACCISSMRPCHMSYKRARERERARVRKIDRNGRSECVGVCVGGGECEGAKPNPNAQNMLAERERDR